MANTTLQLSWKLSGVIASALIISACSNGSSSGDGIVDDDPGANDPVANIETAGRLALYDGGSTSINMLDLDTETVLNSFVLPGGDARLYASPGKRYAVAVQRDDNKVSFIDSGLYAEDHGSHSHDYMDAPVLLDFGLSGTKPTHFSSHEEYAVVFFDAEDGVPSTVTIMSDSDISDGVVTGELTLSNSMHGAAKFVDDHLFVTYRDSSITETVLPAAIERYSLVDGVFTLEQLYEEACPLLHGNASNESLLAFGCSDGVLVVDLTQDGYPAIKLANPDSMAQDSRVGTLYAHPAVKEVVGTAGGQAFVIAPDADESFQELPFPEGVSMVSQGFNTDGETYYIVGDDGMLHLYDVIADWAPLTPVAVADSVGEEDTAPLVVSSGAVDSLFVLNTNGDQIIEVDSIDGTIVRTIDLDFTATRITWLGLSESHQH